MTDTTGDLTQFALRIMQLWISWTYVTFFSIGRLWCMNVFRVLGANGVRNATVNRGSLWRNLLTKLIAVQLSAISPNSIHTGPDLVKR
jgi:hypothetical protein